MKTIKAFTAETDIPADLVRAVIRQHGGWSNFKESASDIADYGAAGGVSGFIYYAETVAFTEKNKADILAMAKAQASDFGADSIYSMIAGFNGLDLDACQVAEAIHDPESEDKRQVFNVLAWYALEEVARAFSDLCDQ